MKENIKEINIKFPIEELHYIPLASKKMGLTINQFLVYAIVMGIHNLEDQLDMGTYNKRSWQEICKEMGWEDDDSFLNLI